MVELCTQINFRKKPPGITTREHSFPSLNVSLVSPTILCIRLAVTHMFCAKKALMAPKHPSKCGNKTGNAPKKPKRERKVLTIKEKVEIIKKIESGRSYVVCARAYGINESTVRYIKKQERHR
ncbi:Tigger transposable element-derived protein 2-like 4 [Homarus americanus]|uniref:Tigger transposable element-derived protein 2-like 4 n=1 Tax=Homarus americanus TaxID=6706 RepID=A0A8J5MUQ1_HOMAM|nr:Tigger transposable element-derived protein 2-like 4 [Homarus americanus]